MEKALIFITILAVAMRVSAEQPAWIFAKEAEEASLSGQAHALEYEGSRGGRCIQISQPGGLLDLARMPRDQNSESALGEARFELDIPEAGEYRVWCRIMWHCYCGVGMNLNTSGAKVVESSSNDSARGDSNVFSTIPPRVWHWVDCGRFKFEAGSAALSFRQRGHLALLDSVEVAADLAYRPVGYIDEKESYRLKGPEEWEPHAEGVNLKPISDREWNDFDFDGAFLPILQNKKPGTFGLEFCQRDSTQCYRLTLNLSADGSGSTQLGRVESGAAVVLHDTSKFVWEGEPLRLHIRKVREKISVELNGTSQFTVQDDGLPAGSIELTAESLDRVKLLELDISPVRVFEEHFTDGADAWVPLSGDWHSIVDDSKQGHVYLCGPPSGGLSLAPWALGEDYTFGASVQLLRGEAAGLAFDAVDLEDFRSIELRAVPEVAGKASMEIAEQKGSERNVLWSQIVEVVPDQWNSLSLTRKSGSLSISINRDEPTHFALDALPTGRVGLITAEGASATFSTVRGLVPGEESSQRYLFLPFFAERALASWKKSAGLFAHAIHPERLMAVPVAGEDYTSLALRRPVSIGQRVVVEFYKNPVPASKTTVIGVSDLPSLPSIVLPTDPYVGIRLSDAEAPGDEYEICTNESEFSVLEVRKNGTVLAHESKRTSTLAEHRMYLELYDERLVVGTESGIVIDTPIERRFSKDGRFNLSVFGKNLTKDTPMGVVEVTVAPCRSKISTVRN